MTTEARTVASGVRAARETTETTKTTEARTVASVVRAARETTTTTEARTEASVVRAARAARETTEATEATDRMLRGCDAGSWRLVYGAVLLSEPLCSDMFGRVV